jgi:hypothetical protein
MMQDAIKALAMEVQRLIMNPAIKVLRSVIHVAIQFVRIK